MGIYRFVPALFVLILLIGTAIVIFQEKLEIPRLPSRVGGKFFREVSLEELEEISKELRRRPIFEYGIRKAIAAAEGAAPAPVPAPPPAPERFARTTTVYKGVEEYDIIKTDGIYIYAFSDGKLLVLDKNLSLIKETEIPLLFGDIKGILTDYKGKLFIISGDWENTFLYETNREELVEGKEKFRILRANGSFIDARYNGKYVVIITRTWNRIPIFKEGRQRFFIERDGPKSLSFVNVYVFNPKSGKVDTYSFEATDFETWTFKDNIYLVFWNYRRWPDIEEIVKECKILTEEEINSLLALLRGEGVAEISIETLEKIKECYFNALKLTYSSIIVKINPDTKEVIEGAVPGRLLNTFSIDEYNGWVRVATTIRGFVPSRELRELIRGNNIYVLDSSNLEVVGSLEGLEKDEEIYAVRFLGDKVLLVTYRRIDPFFVIDVSNPEEPKVLGRLKIPGYSTYLHPINETWILGIGWEEGKVKVSLYDISNFSNPIEISKLTLEGFSRFSHRFRSDTYKEFLIDEDNKMIFLPIKKTYYIWRAYTEEEITPEDYLAVVSYEGGDLLLEAKLLHDSVERSFYIGLNLYTYSRHPFLIKKWEYFSWEKEKEFSLTSSS